jgi:histidine triad (HIT) family protein
MSHPDCVFCKIIAGTIPSARLYEDDRVLAIMDIGPIIKGHALVIPKTHYDPLMETPDEVLAELIAVVRRIAKAQVAGLGADGINVTQANGPSAGQVVPHIHFHVIPRFASDGHHWNWNAKRYDSPEELKQYAGRILAGLKQTGTPPCART